MLLGCHTPVYTPQGSPQSGFEPFDRQSAIDNFNGVIPPVLEAGVSDPRAVTPSGVGEFDGIYQSGDQMVTDQMTSSTG